MFDNISLPSEIYSPPEGLIGEIAQFIYSAAPRPVPEIALSAAFGIMAGVCGRCYNISGTGLNHYIILLALTGRGKEQMNSGISKLLGSISSVVKDARLFHGPAKIQSQEALLKHLSKTSRSFISIMSEFSDTLKRMSNDSRNLPQQGVKQAMLDLYNKSGKGQILSNMIYSDTDKNTDVLTAPAFSLLAETVPDKFYELLTEDMIAEGFLPRFTIIEYLGNRPPFNEQHENVVVPEKLKEQFGQLCAYSLQLNSSNNVIQITINEDAKRLLNKFNESCDAHINNGNNAAMELWNRAHIRALKLSGLLAVGNNYINPKVSLDQAQWAVNLVAHNIQQLLAKFETGEVGGNNGEKKQIDKLIKVFVDYITRNWSDVKKYGGTEQLHNDRIIPYVYIQRRLINVSCFKSDRIGASNAIKRTVKILVDNGDIVDRTTTRELRRNDIYNKYGYTGDCYFIKDVQMFLNVSRSA